MEVHRTVLIGRRSEVDGAPRPSRSGDGAARLVHGRRVETVGSFVDEPIAARIACEVPRRHERVAEHQLGARAREQRLDLIDAERLLSDGRVLDLAVEMAGRPRCRVGRAARRCRTDEQTAAGGDDWSDIRLGLQIRGGDA
jgi:hypothetical protein